MVGKYEQPDSRSEGERFLDSFLRSEWKERARQIHAHSNPEVLCEILPLYVFLTFAISQEMRLRFAPAVATEILNEDVLTWIARYLKDARDQVFLRNPEFSEDDKRMIDFMLDACFETLTHAMRKID